MIHLVGDFPTVKEKKSERAKLARMIASVFLPPPGMSGYPDHSCNSPTVAGMDCKTHNWINGRR
jgi:hypothetical protein